MMQSRRSCQILPRIIKTAIPLDMALMRADGKWRRGAAAAQKTGSPSYGRRMKEGLPSPAAAQKTGSPSWRRRMKEPMRMV
jgi:hypothetical protein